MAETWIINEQPNTDNIDNVTVNFTANGQNFYGFNLHIDTEPIGQNILRYSPTGESPFHDNVDVYSSYGWSNQIYRTVTFETTPTGVLLSWLQANAVKQALQKLSTPVLSLSDSKLLIDSIDTNATKIGIYRNGSLYDTIQLEPEPSDETIVGVWTLNKTTVSPLTLPYDIRNPTDIMSITTDMGFVENYYNLIAPYNEYVFGDTDSLTGMNSAKAFFTAVHKGGNFAGNVTTIEILSNWLTTVGDMDDENTAAMYQWLQSNAEKQ